MKRWLGAALTFSVFSLGLAAFALSPAERSELELARSEIIEALDANAAERVSLESALARIDALLATTTTTAAPTTTTIATTTTAPTTTQPPTTTTFPDPAPPTGDAFTIQLRGLDNPATPQIEPNRFWWDAPYFRSLNSGAGWVDGDRLAYNCAYMFLRDGSMIRARVTFVRIQYAMVNDRFMLEGQRLFDGTFSGAGGQLYHPSFCSDILADEYTFSNTPDERPVVRIVDTDEVLEVRSYRNTVVGEGLTFDQVGASDTDFTIIDPNGDVSTVYSRVTVLARENGNAVIAVYYDSLDPNVRITSDLP